MYRFNHKLIYSSLVYLFIMAALRSRCGHYIFIMWFFILLSSSFFFPRLISAVTDCMSAILPHMVALVRISDAGLKHAARGSLKIQDAKNRQKFVICAPSHNFVTYQQSEKRGKQQYLPYISSQYGELRPTSGWDRFGSLVVVEFIWGTQQILAGFASLQRFCTALW